MLKQFCLSAALIAAVAMPALAGEECGSTPVRPAFPANVAKMPVTDATKAVWDSYHLLKTYQSQLATLRGCLTQQDKADNEVIAAAAAKPDDAAKGDAAKQRIAERDAMNDKTVDAEQQTVNEFAKLRTDYCTLDGADSKVCPKPKK